MQFIRKTGIIKNVTVIGGGQIGSGIVQAIAQNGNNVVLVEKNKNRLKLSAERIVNCLANKAKEIHKENGRKIIEYIEKAMEYIIGTTDFFKAIQDADLIIEAIDEDPVLKSELLKSINIDTLVASTTDSISINFLAKKVNKPECFVGLHYIHPILSTRLVEIVRNDHTSKETLDSVTAWCKNIDKIAVICNDSPGFIVNRLIATYITEAIRLMERSNASKRDVDQAMKLITGQKFGPFELADRIGHDTINNWLETWRFIEPENMILQPCRTQEKLLEKGKYGVKSGEGFYKYNDLDYWVRNLSGRFKNKKEWVKHYLIWKRKVRNKSTN